MNVNVGKISLCTRSSATAEGPHDALF